MISQLIKKCKYITQSIYNLFIQSINLSKCVCSCGAHGRFYKHGYYVRSVKNPNNKVQIAILRLKCKSCGKTHAILHPDLIPYSQIIYDDTINIILTYEQGQSSKNILINNPEITESDVRYTIKKYLKYWRDRLLSISAIPIHKLLPSYDIRKSISNNFRLAFMQIKRCYYRIN